MTPSGAWAQLEDAHFSKEKIVDYCVQLDEHLTKQMISFQMSKEWLDWLCNFLCFPWIFRGKVVHFGFWLQYHLIRKDLRKHILGAKDSLVEISGYSLGGALAQLCYFDLKKDGYTNLKLVVFGSPRPFYFGYKGTLYDIQKIVCGMDVVTMLPPWCIEAQGKTVRLGKRGKFPSAKDHAQYGRYL